MTIKLKSDIKQRWLEALRSGKYEQTESHLRTSTGFCCLGVLCDLVVPERWVRDTRWGVQLNPCGAPEYDVLPEELSDLLYSQKEGTVSDPYVYLDETQRERLLCAGMSDQSVRTLNLTRKAKLSVLNDSGFTFQEIADIIEKQL